MSGFTDYQVTSDILEQFVNRRGKRSLTECILQPPVAVREFRTLKRDELLQQVQQFLAWKQKEDEFRAQYARGNEKIVTESDYYYFLNLGAIYLYLEDYERAAEYFSKAKDFPKVNKHSETDNWLELPCLLAGACLELSGDTAAALKMYQEGQEYRFKSRYGAHDYEKSIARCELRLQQHQSVHVTYVESVQHPLSTSDNADFSRAALYQRLDQLQLLNEQLNPQQFADVCFSKLAAEDYWRLVIAGEQQIRDRERGWLGWESREKNSVYAMEDVYRFISANIEQSITPDFVSQIHKIATTGITGTNGRLVELNEAVIPGEYRTTEVGYHCAVGTINSIEGIKYYQDLLNENRNPYVFYCSERDRISEFGTIQLKYRAKKAPQEFLRSQIKEALDEYQRDIIKTEIQGNYLEIIRVIMRCVKKMEVAHVYRDGNGRTMYAIMNMMLMQNRLPPAILFDPNYIDGYTENELVDVVLQGMQDYFCVVDRGCYPGGMTTVDLIRDNIAFANTQNKITFLPSGKERFWGTELGVFKVGLDTEVVLNQYKGQGKVTVENKLLDQLRADFLRLVATGQTGLVRSYLMNGMDPRVTDKFGNHALVIAAYYGHLDVVRLLLKTAPDLVNLRGQDQMSALYVAARNGHAAIVSELLTHQADPHACSAYGDSSAEVAEHHGHQSIAAQIAAAADNASAPMQTDDLPAYVPQSLYFRGITPNLEAKAGEKQILTLLSGQSFNEWLDTAIKVLENADKYLLNAPFAVTALCRKFNDELISNHDNLRHFKRDRFAELYHALCALDLSTYQLEDKLMVQRAKNNAIGMYAAIPLNYNSKLPDLITRVQEASLHLLQTNLDEEQALAKLLNADYIAVLATYLRQYNWVEQLKTLVNTYPGYGERIIDCLITSGLLRSKLLKDSDSKFKDLVVAMPHPALREKIVRIVMTDQSLCDACFTIDYYLAEKIALLPDCNEIVFNRYVSEPDKLVDVLKGESKLRYFMQAFCSPAQTRATWNLIRDNQAITAGILDSFYHLEELIKLAPQLRDDFFAMLIKDLPRIKNLLKSFYDIEKLLTIFNGANQIPAIWSIVLNNHDLYRQCFSSVNDYKCAALKSTSLKKILFSKLNSDPICYERLHLGSSSFLDLLQTFDEPTMQRTIISKILSTPEQAAGLVKNDSDLLLLAAKIPSKKRLLFNAWLKHGDSSGTEHITQELKKVFTDPRDQEKIDSRHHATAAERTKRMAEVQELAKRKTLDREAGASKLGIYGHSEDWHKASDDYDRGYGHSRYNRFL